MTLATIPTVNKRYKNNDNNKKIPTSDSIHHTNNHKCKQINIHFILKLCLSLRFHFIWIIVDNVPGRRCYGLCFAVFTVKQTLQLAVSPGLPERDIDFVRRSSTTTPQGINQAAHTA